MGVFDRDDERGEAPTADFDVAGRAFEEAKAGTQPREGGAPRWAAWAVVGGVALAALGFVADHGWERATMPYASWYWPDQAPGMQIAHGGSRWVLDTRQPSVTIADETMEPTGYFNNVPYFAPRGGGGGGADVPAPVYIRVGPDRYIPLVQGGPTPDELRRRLLEGDGFPVPEGQAPGGTR
jgi:hypothetical protein